MATMALPFIAWLGPTPAAMHALQLSRGDHVEQVVHTEQDIPRGAAVLTLVYVPAAHDARLGPFYLIDAFDPAVHNPFRDAAYLGPPP